MWRRASVSAWLLALLALLAVALWAYLPPNAVFVAGGGLGGTQVIGAGFPKRLIDPAGREHLLEAPPRRIVSAILAGDEMLAELVPVERVVGVSNLVDDASISNVAGHYPPGIARVRADAEVLLALQPDLVLVSTYSDAAAVRMLLAAGVAVVRVAAFDSFDEAAASLRLLGEILGVPMRANAAVDEMERRLAEVAAQVAGRTRPKTLYYSRGGSTGGPGTLTDEMIQRAGGYNLIRETGITGHRQITRELAIALQPEVIILSDWSGGGGSAVADELRNSPAWQAAPAVRNGNVYALPGGWVTSGSQFRVAGVEALARRLHPEAFDAPPP